MIDLVPSTVMDDKKSHGPLSAGLWFKSLIIIEPGCKLQTKTEVLGATSAGLTEVCVQLGRQQPALPWILVFFRAFQNGTMPH